MLARRAEALLLQPAACAEPLTATRLQQLLLTPAARARCCKHPLCAGADAVVLPTRGEGWGRPQMEVRGGAHGMLKRDDMLKPHKSIRVLWMLPWQALAARFLCQRPRLPPAPPPPRLCRWRDHPQHNFNGTTV